MRQNRTRVPGPVRALRLALLCTATVSARSWSASPDIDALLTRLARPAPASTAFLEVHFSHLLAHPLMVGGQLQYLGRDSLARSVEHPYQERTEVHGDAVTVARGSSVRHFSLEHAPELRSLLSSFSALLGGDRDLLAQQFTLAATGTDAHWSLELTPRDPRVRARVALISVDGAGSEPRCITTTEPGGNSSVMLLGPLAQIMPPAAADVASLRTRCQAD
jgi:hypothetical protein